LGAAAGLLVDIKRPTFFHQRPTGRQAGRMNHRKKEKTFSLFSSISQCISYQRLLTGKTHFGLSLINCE
jgi:hypothetical protein